MTTILDPTKSYKTKYTKTYLDSVNPSIYTFLTGLGYVAGTSTVLSGEYLDNVLLGADQLEPDVILDANGDQVCFAGLNGCGASTLTCEDVQDCVGGMLNDVGFTYNDAENVFDSTGSAGGVLKSDGLGGSTWLTPPADVLESAWNGTAFSNPAGYAVGTVLASPVSSLSYTNTTPYPVKVEATAHRSYGLAVSAISGGMSIIRYDGFMNINGGGFVANRMDRQSAVFNAAGGTNTTISRYATSLGIYTLAPGASLSVATRMDAVVELGLPIGLSVGLGQITFRIYG